MNKKVQDYYSMRGGGQPLETNLGNRCYLGNSILPQYDDEHQFIEVNINCLVKYVYIFFFIIILSNVIE